MARVFPAHQVNAYLAHKQHLLPSSHGSDVLQVTRDIVALHASSATSPYLSLWARLPDFRLEHLEAALYERRELAKVLCMRVTVHAVPADEVPLFMRSHESLIDSRLPPRFRDGRLLAYADLCTEEEAKALQEELFRRVLQVLADRGPSTAQEIGEAVPALKATIRHDAGRAYEGQFSIGSRLLGDMAARGLIIRARPRGSWRSNLYEYAAFADWLPGVDVHTIGVAQAREGVVQRYLRAFGPARFEDLQWWTGWGAADLRKALEPQQPRVCEVGVDGHPGAFLMLREDAQRLADFQPPAPPYGFLLPSLDPYIMGYQDRRRFLAEEHADKVFDRGGNALPTVWANGRVVGAWGQRKDATVVSGLFERIDDAAQELLVAEARRLQAFLGNEYVKPALFHTPFTRALESA